MIVKYPKGLILKLSENGPVLEYEGKKYQWTKTSIDPFGLTVVKIAPNKPVNFISLGNYGEAQIIADHGVIDKGYEKKEVAHEDFDSKPAKG